MHRTSWITSVLLVFAVGCGGSQKPEEEESGGWLTDSEPEYEEADDTLIPPEKFDEINMGMNRKAPAVSRCFARAIEEGAVKPDTKGVITVGLVITPAGEPTDIHILPSSTIKQDMVAKCVVAEIATANLPTLPKKLEFTYSYKLSRDY